MGKNGTYSSTVRWLTPFLDRLLYGGRRAGGKRKEKKDAE